MLVLVYLLSPFDLIPGFLPVIGEFDDFALMLLGLKALTYVAPGDLVAQLKHGWAWTRRRFKLRC